MYVLFIEKLKNLKIMTERDLHDIIYTYPNDLILGEMFRRAFLCIKDSRDEPKEEELKPFIEILKKSIDEKV